MAERARSSRRDGPGRSRREPPGRSLWQAGPAQELRVGELDAAQHATVEGERDRRAAPSRRLLALGLL